MASADCVAEESFLSSIERIRSEIHNKFQEAHRMLQDREADLIAELQRLTDEYTGEGIAEHIKQLSISKDALEETLTDKVIFDESIAPINTRITELEANLQRVTDTYISVSLEWDVDLEKKLSLAGEVRLNAVKGLREYKEIGCPVAVFGKHSKEDRYTPGVFSHPLGIAINPTNNYIYICDLGNDRVQVFSKSFEFVFQFNEKMGRPAGICIQQNKVYVTQFSSHCLNVYSTEGKYINSVGVKGTNELEFDGMRGLDISTDKGRIYLTEFGNDRVQCLNLSLGFVSFINDIYGAKDVKLTSDEIVVLSLRNPCVCLYSYSHQVIREIIPRGKSKSVSSPCSFSLNKSLHILITDFTHHCVFVFSYGGVLIHRFGKEGKKRGSFIDPRGIAIDAEGRILVTSRNSHNCIQVF